MGLFVLISLLVMVPGRGRAVRAEPGPVWLGGPSGSEHGVSTSGLVLTGGAAPWATVPERDWVAEAEAETAEPDRHLGGASAGW
ncbi:hypothetical protein DMB42_19725 [Nonomuraea sp. WAC 01424]|uniref:hypothetical protein n=1 Tax=Nonomuraea sp. WAC 01424 TaxID=2203200 RepID=UPI000F7B0EE9|nr:hypothetical protein [Nonomuraea sp. WAC 01424]RSN09518.1 hypothetical protein DMB42_19725 [Nonomuraea sp. WAC 01424]